MKAGVEGGGLSASRLGRITPVKEPRYPQNMRLDGPRSRPGHFEETKIFCTFVTVSQGREETLVRWL